MFGLVLESTMRRRLEESEEFWSRLAHENLEAANRALDKLNEAYAEIEYLNEQLNNKK